MHVCQNEGEIAAMKGSLDRLEKIVLGNGQPGLYQIVTRLDQSVETLSGNTEKLAVAVSGLVKFQSETIGEVRAAQKNKTNMQWALGLLIATIFSVIGIIIKVNA